MQRHIDASQRTREPHVFVQDAVAIPMKVKPSNVRQRHRPMVSTQRHLEHRRRPEEEEER